MALRLLALTATLFATVLPVAAQEAVPLLRVYIDAPYFYEFMAEAPAPDASGDITIRLYIEGKEVGESNVAYRCADQSYDESVVSEWTGGAERFVPAALMAYAQLYC